MKTAWKTITADKLRQEGCSIWNEIRIKDQKSGPYQSIQHCAENLNAAGLVIVYTRIGDLPITLEKDYPIQVR